MTIEELFTAEKVTLKMLDELLRFLPITALITVLIVLMLIGCASTKECRTVCKPLEKCFYLCLDSWDN